ncbi:MAG: hypothetical protein IJI06_02415 [Oscillospiraceae bacterium]|nr:hypothetical protein [Oscillospiraceae bacterium]
MSRIKPFWRIVLGFLILCVFVYNSNMMAMGDGFWGFAFWGAFLAAYIFAAIKIPYDDPVRSMRDLMAQQVTAENLRWQQTAAADPPPARQQTARVGKHGSLWTNVAGVTFKNPDGSSRQQILADLMESGGDAEVTLEEFYYKGVQAVRVLVDGRCIGNIPKHRVQDVREILDRIVTAELNVETFEPDDADPDGPAEIYRADLYLVYKK